MKDTVLTKRMASVFRLYYKLGMLQGDKTTFEICRLIEGVCGTNKRLAAELLAAHETVKTLKVLGEFETFRALRAIYLTSGIWRTYKKNEISYRILRFAFENHIDERTVYRRLNKAKKIWIGFNEQNKNKADNVALR